MPNSTINLVQVTIPNNKGIAETPTIFTFEFSKDIGLASSALQVTLIMRESNVIKGERSITKPLIPFSGDPKKATAQLTFPESLAGAKLTISYVFIKSPINTGVIKSDIEIILLGNVCEIEKICWGEQEHALWGAKLTERKDICKNEAGFLHIYTKGMFGHQVWVELMEEDVIIDDSLERRRVTVQDNVVSVPYSMESVISIYKSKYWTLWFEGKTLQLYGRTHTVKSELKKGLKSSILLLYHDKIEANPSQITTETDVKVKITTDEESLGEPTKAQCILQFRSNNTYKGDYGFDWVRMGDTGPATAPAINMPRQTPASAAGHHNDFAYEEYMGVHYYDTSLPRDPSGINPIPALYNNQIEHNGNNKGNVFKKDIDPNTTVFRPEVDYNANTYKPGTIPDNTFGGGSMYKKLKLRYRRLIFNWDPKDAAGTTSEAYTPIMTLMKGKVADLALHLDIKKQPKEIVFEFDHSSASSFFDLDKDKLTANLSETKVNKTDKINHKLEITCKGEFSREYMLFARAFKKDNSKTGPDLKGEICGMVRILPNGPKFQHKVKVLFIEVKTNITGSTRIGRCPGNAQTKFIDILRQGFVIPEIITTQEDGSALAIDTLSPKHANNKSVNFRDKFCIFHGGNYVIDVGDSSKGWKMRTYLLDELKCIDKGKYENYYKIFYIDENVNTSTAGYSWGEKYVVCFNSVGALDMLPVHEVLHSLELAHPFDAYSRNTPFSHHFCTTNNVMDYTQSFRITDTKTLFHWQWQIINSKIR